jgi:hypothetical protein
VPELKPWLLTAQVLDSGLQAPTDVACVQVHVVVRELSNCQMPLSAALQDSLLQLRRVTRASC